MSNQRSDDSARGTARGTEGGTEGGIEGGTERGTEGGTEGGTARGIERGTERGVTIRNQTLLLGSSLTVMAGATVAPALPEMRAAFAHLPNSELLVKLVLTTPALAIALAAPWCGKLLDQWGRKPILLLALVLYGIAGSSGLYLDSLVAILIGRALLGVAVAGIMTACTTLIADHFQGPRRNSFMGLQAAYMGFGGVLFLVAGGTLADQGWRAPFLVYLGALLLLPGAICCLSEPVRGARSDAATMMAAARAELPARKLWLAYLLALWIMLVFYMVPAQLPFYLQSLEPVSNARVGVALACMNLFAASVALLYRRVRERLAVGEVFAVGFLTMAVGYLVIGSGGSYAVLIGGLALSGIGLGLLMPNVNVWLVSFVPAPLRGRAIGGLTTFFFLGQFLSPILSQPLIRRLGPAAGYRAAGFGLLLVACLYLIYGRRRRAVGPAGGGESDAAGKRPIQ